MGDYSNAAMATEMNNTEITNVYFIATFFNCQEVRQRKRWWGKKSLLENVKWSRLDRVSFRISWNDTYAHTDFGILHMKLPRLHESTVDYTSKHLWKQTWSLNMGQKVTWQDYNEGPSLNILNPISCRHSDQRLAAGGGHYDPQVRGWLSWLKMLLLVEI